MLTVNKGYFSSWNSFKFTVTILFLILKKLKKKKSQEIWFLLEHRNPSSIDLGQYLRGPSVSTDLRRGRGCNGVRSDIICVTVKMLDFTNSSSSCQNGNSVSIGSKLKWFVSGTYSRVVTRPSSITIWSINLILATNQLHWMFLVSSASDHTLFS